MRLQPEETCRLAFEFTNPWDIKPWFSYEPSGKKRRSSTPEEYPVLYTHYRILDFTKFNPPEPTPGAQVKAKGKKGKGVVEGAAIIMKPFEQLPPSEVMVDRIMTGEIWPKRPGSFVKLTMKDPFGIEKVPIPLSLEQL